MVNLEFTKIIRDPLLGYVHLTENEIKLLDTPVFQRLRRIKQLANTDLVYPGAVHTRFEHSLGVLETAYRIAERIPSIRNNLDKIKQIRYAALLHDIGHGPYSHVFEDIVARITRDSKFKHELISREILQVDDDIRSIVGSDIDGVLDLLTSTQKNRVEYGIISGPLDADKLDYLRRDSYHAGVAYGVFDATRVLYTLKEIKRKILGSEESYLGVDMKGREAVIGMLLAYYYMHETVYGHKTRRIADTMLVRSVELAVKEQYIDSNLFSFRSGDKDFIESFKLLDDRSLLDMLLEKSKGVAKDIAFRLENRNLFKAVFGKDLKIFDPVKRNYFQRINIDETKKLEEQIGEHLKIDPSYVIVDRQSISNPLYREPGSIPRAELILLQDKDEQPIDLSEVPSPISGKEMKSVERLWVFVPVQNDSERKKIEEKLYDFLSTW